MFVLEFEVVCVLLVLNAFTVESSQSWQQDSLTVRQGSSFNVTCTATDIDLLDVVRVVLHTKDGVMLTIADDTHLKTPFSNLSRYSVTYDYHNKVGQLTLLYNGILGEDAGTLQCLRLGSEKDVAELQLHVLVPVSDVYITAISGQEASRVNSSDGIVHLREIQQEGIGCIVLVADALMRPTVIVTVNGTDETHRFMVSETSHKLPSFETSIVQPVMTSYELVYVTMMPERSFNKQILTCAAVADGFKPVLAQASVHVEYAPVIMCRLYEHYGKVSGSVTITCTVEANPRSRVTWLNSHEQPVVNSTSTTLNEKMLTSDITQVQLTFHSIHESDFGPYYLVADNDIRAAEITVVLYHAYDSENPPPPNDKLSQLRMMMAQSSGHPMVSSSGSTVFYKSTVTTSLLCVHILIFHILVSH
jgi:hypothetical protein